MMEEGIIVFYVTTANGSVPISGASVKITVEGNEKTVLTDENGKTPPLNFCFFDRRPHLAVIAEISFENLKKAILDDIKLYRSTTIVRIVNLDQKR